MRTVYLDNAAATPVSLETLAIFNKYIETCYANQEAAHGLAYQVREMMDKAAATLAHTILDDPKVGVCWGNSTTELFNLTANFPAFQRGNIVTTALEHPALLAALKRTGAEIRMVAPNPKTGQIEAQTIAKFLDEKTSLVAIHHVQSETGMIQNLQELSTTIKSCAPQALFLSDTVQSAGKIIIPWKIAGLDLAYCSGHKIGAPGGAALFCRDQKVLNFLKKARAEEYLSGRPDPAQCLTLAATVAKIERNKLAGNANVLKTALLNELLNITLPNSKKPIQTISTSLTSPFILHLLLPGMQAAVIARMLSQRGIHIASGSACQAESKQPSSAILTLGYSREEAYSGIRISTWNNPIEEIEHFIEEFKDIIKNY
ncbi:MAG: aminotransferase class V-fold PLP-dependent enzyme [Victivallaceae bacterium]|nr:aminotransferase class V-fold PLP-dependent enzyme [Victivallaceae bacterium]